MILIIDDLRNLQASVEAELNASGTPFTIARNSSEGLNLLKSPDASYNAIYLDHDLGLVNGKIDTIMPVVDYLCELAYNLNPVKVETIYVHTSNPVGGNQMVQSLSRYGYNVVRIAPETIFTV